MKIKLFSLAALVLCTSQAQASWVTTYLQWTDLALGHGQVSRGNYVRSIPGSESLVGLRLNYGSTAMKRIYSRLSNQEVIENNNNLLRLVKQGIDFESNYNGFDPMDDAIKSVNQNQVRELYRAMTTSDVVRNQRNYGGRGVGFCFGRALVAHYQALIRNVHPASLRKIWVVGDMGFWGHHVSTIVKSGDSWMAIDNYTGVMSVEDWMQRMEQEQKGGKNLMFFITRAGRFGHATNSLYNTIDLFNVTQNRIGNYESETARRTLKSGDFYKGFFMDFYDDLSQDAVIVRRYSEEEAEQARIQAALQEAERVAAATALKASDVSSYELSQETIYCFNSENQKLNCNYQLGEENNRYETSVSLTGMAQYLVQKRGDQEIYARHIINPDVEDRSAQIVKDAQGMLTKYYVELVKPEHTPIRPYLKVLGTDTSASQAELETEVMQIKDVLAEFNEEYQVTAENASPLVRIQNASGN